MRGSWAGAMGHTQFIPTSYLSYAVDFTGDGRRDIWSDDPTDALASAANYLARSGWTRGQPWGVEVRLPEGFNYGSADQSNIRPVADWRARGVTLDERLAAARPRPGGDHRACRRARAGLRGLPQLLRHQAVQQRHLLRDGRRPPRRPHRRRRPVRGRLAARRARASRTEKIELQERLIARGYATGATDGVIGPDTIAAIRAYQSREGLTPDGFATAPLLARLR